MDDPSAIILLAVVPAFLFAGLAVYLLKARRPWFALGSAGVSVVCTGLTVFIVNAIASWSP